MIKVINEVRIYEINGEKTAPLSPPKMQVESHWTDNERVTIIMGGSRYTVLARDLKISIDNATNIAH